MRETNFERQQREQAKRTRDMLKVASVHITSSRTPGLSKITKVNDNDPSTYYYGTYVGPGPANPNMFWQGQSRTELKSNAKASEMYDLAKAKGAGFSNVKDYERHQAEQKYIREQQERARVDAVLRERKAKKAREAAERAQRDANRAHWAELDRKQAERFRQYDADYAETTLNMDGRQKLMWDYEQRRAAEQHFINPKQYPATRYPMEYWHHRYNRGDR